MRFAFFGTFWAWVRLVSVSRARGGRGRGGGRGWRRASAGAGTRVVGGRTVRAAGSAGVVRAVGQVVGRGRGGWFPDAGVRSTGLRFPGGSAVAGRWWLGGGWSRGTVFGCRGHHWHHRHHGHSEARLLNQLGDEESEHQGDCQLGQDQGLHGLEADQGDEDRHQGFHLELQQQQHWKQEFLLQ